MDKKANIHEIGNAIYATMTKEEREALGCKSDTIELVCMLGLESAPIQRHKHNAITRPSYATVGLVLRFLEDTEIPVLPIRPISVVKATGFAPDEYKTRFVKAGEEVAMSTFEWMYLVSRPEYCGKHRGEGAHEWLRLQVIFSKYINGDSVIPVPTPTYDKGSPSEMMECIDEKDENGDWRVKPEFERFAGIYMDRKKSGVQKASSIDAAQRTALAIYEILENLKKKGMVG